MKHPIIYIAYILLASTGMLHAQCAEDNNYWAESWRSCSTSINPNSVRGESHWLLFEFTEPIGIGDTHFWNANKIGQSDSGLKDVILEVSREDGTWIQVGDGPFSWEKAPEIANYEGFDGPNLSSYGLITKILITVESTYGDGSCASLAEVRFNVDPNACTGELDACNICDGPGFLTFYLDADGDGQGNPNIFLQSCELPEEGYVNNNNDTCDTGGWEQVGAIFEANACTGCHNQAAEGGLDLTSYASFLLGGDKCGTNILTGNTLINIIQIDGYDECGQAIVGLSMNSRAGNTLTTYEINQIQSWINAGVPEDSSCQNTIDNPIPEGEETSEEVEGENMGEEISETRLFPNPSNGLINIATADANSIEGVEVYDLGGRKIYQLYTVGEHIELIDLRNKNLEGVFIVRLIGRLEEGETEAFQKVFIK